MKSFNKFLLLAFSLAIFSTSCSSDDDALTESTPLGFYEDGYFVLNEGTSTSTSGVDFISYLGVKTEDVFRIENPNQAEIGKFLQNIFFDATRAFIVSGSTNSITVVNRFTFKHITTITTNLDTPRYGVVLKGKAYVTNQSSFSTGADDFVTVINLIDYSTSSILVGDYVDKLTLAGNKIAIANGAFGNGNAVTILNPSNSNSLTSIDLGAGNSPNSILYKDDKVYALTGSQKFVTIDPSSEILGATLDLPSSITSPKNLQIENNEVYFTSSNSVYSFTLGDTTVSTTPLLSYTTTSAWGAMYGFAVRGVNIYIGDGTDFASSGKIFQYNIGGDLVNQYTSSGIGPNGFYFN